MDSLARGRDWPVREVDLGGGAGCGGAVFRGIDRMGGVLEVGSKMGAIG